MNKKSFLLLFVTLFLITPAVLHAQSTWSLERCIDHALINNLDIRRQQLEVERARHAAIQSYGNFLPTLSGSSSYGYRYGRSVDQVTNEIFTQRIASQNMYMSGSLNLFSGFQAINSYRLNQARQNAVSYETESMENDLILSIANAYLRILYLEDLVDITGQQLSVSTEQLERTRVLKQGGTVTRGHLLEMEAMAAEEEVRYTNAQNQLSLAYLDLIILLELDPEDDFSIERPVLVMESHSFFYDPDHIYQKALQTEPSIFAAQERVEMAEKNLAISRGSRIPNLFLTSSLSTAYSEAFRRLANNDNANTLATIPRSANPNDYMLRNGDPVFEVIPYREQLSQNFSRNIQIGINIPILNRLQARTSIQYARIDLEQSRLNYERQKNNLGRVIHQAHADALAAYKSYMSNEKSLEAARESFHFADQRFNMGLMSSVEFNEAKTRLNRAEINALQAMYEFIFMAKILEFYQGEGFSL